MYLIQFILEPPLRPPTFTIGSGSDQHSEGHAFSQGDPNVASHGFIIQTSQTPYTNRKFQILMILLLWN